MEGRALLVSKKWCGDLASLRGVIPRAGRMQVGPRLLGCAGKVGFVGQKLRL